MIAKVDSSKVGWSAAVHYEKSNGLLLKSDSGKLWEEAEKKVLESKKAAAKEAKEKTPFRWGPLATGVIRLTKSPKVMLLFWSSTITAVFGLLCWLIGARPLLTE